jgi:hypothetical protein
MLFSYPLFRSKLKGVRLCGGPLKPETKKAIVKGRGYFQKEGDRGDENNSLVDIEGYLVE